MSCPATRRTAPARVNCALSDSSMPFSMTEPGVVMSITPSTSCKGIKDLRSPRLTAEPATRPFTTTWPETVTAWVSVPPCPAIRVRPSAALMRP